MNRRSRSDKSTGGDSAPESRSSRPRRSLNRTPRSIRRRVLHLRRTRRWGADHIGHELGLASSTVQSILRGAGLARLDRGDRATDTGPILRYQRERPGELIHVDVKKVAGIPAGGGWKIHGRGNDTHAAHAGVGYRFIHTAIDDRARIVDSEIHTNEQADTAARFWGRAAAFSAALGFSCERVITDNGSCYRSGRWHQACAATGTTVKKTRPRRPQTDGKVERFHRILLEEWAYIRAWHSDEERTTPCDGFIHLNNHHRSHGALGWQSPIATLATTARDNHLAEHS